MIYNDIDFHQTTILLAKSRWFMVDHGCIIMIPFVPVKSPWKSTVFFRCQKKTGPGRRKTSRGPDQAPPLSKEMTVRTWFQWEFQDPEMEVR